MQYHHMHSIVAYNNVFRFLCNEPRDCSASYMFVSRGLPTCKMLIRKSVYSFLTCIATSGNAILQSIMNIMMLCIIHHCVAIGRKCFMYIVISLTLGFHMDVMFRNKVIELN